MGCSRAGNFAVQNADLILVIGNRLTSMTTGTESATFGREAKIVAIDIDPIEHQKGSARIDKVIELDARLLLERLIMITLPPVSSDWLTKCLHWKKIFSTNDSDFQASEKIDLYQLADVLSIALPDNSIFVSDSGLCEVILPTNIKFGRGIRCIHPASQGAMGFALPAAVGAQFASSQRVIVAVGDGSIMMNLQELQTIKSHQLPILILVINNNAYSIIRKRQMEMFRNRTIGTDPSNGVECPDFKKVAQAFDIEYCSISGNKTLLSEITEVLSRPGPVICEIMGLEDQDYIQTSQARNSSNLMVRRPLEDQAPFLDRDLFHREMLIKPID